MVTAFPVYAPSVHATQLILQLCSGDIWDSPIYAGDLPRQPPYEPVHTYFLGMLIRVCPKDRWCGRYQYYLEEIRSYVPPLIFDRGFISRSRFN